MCIQKCMSHTVDPYEYIKHLLPGIIFFLSGIQLIAPCVDTKAS